MDIPQYKKTVKVICDYYTMALTGKTTQNATFMIDWNAILKPNTPYYVNYTMMGGLQAYDGTKPAYVQTNLNLTSYRGGIEMRAQTDNTLGIIQPLLERPTGSNCLFYDDITSNYNSYMERRPNNNFLNIRIVDGLGNAWTTPASAAPDGWVIELHFTEAINLPKCYKIYLNNYSTQSIGTANNNRTFNIDMNSILDRRKKYKIGFTLMGAKATSANILASINWGLDTVYPFADGTFSTSFNILGAVSRGRYDTGANSLYVKCDTTTNQMVTLNNWSNTINLRFLDSALALSSIFPAGAADYYAVCLYIEEM